MNRWKKENFFPPPSSNVWRVRDSLWECSQRGTSNTPKCFFRCLYCQMCVSFFLLLCPPPPLSAHLPACLPSDTLMCKSSAQRLFAPTRQVSVKVGEIADGFNPRRWQKVNAATRMFLFLQKRDFFSPWRVQGFDRRGECEDPVEKLKWR